MPNLNNHRRQFLPIIVCIKLFLHCSLVYAEAIPFSKLAKRSLTEMNAGPSWKQGPLVRVRIAKGLPMATFSGLDISREIFVTKDKKSYTGKKNIKFNCLNASANKKKGERILLASLSSANGVLSFDWEKYQGDMHVVADSSGGGGCDVINQTTMEQYLSTLLGKEMNSSWPLEALKAQAVAARTYALYKVETQSLKKGPYDLESSEKDQVSGAIKDSTDHTRLATSETKGEVLVTENGQVTPIFFHAKCGGRTLTASDVWGNNVEGYKSVKCPFCRNLGNGPWQFKIEREKMVQFLNWYRKKEVNDAKNWPRNFDNKSIVLANDHQSSLTLRVYIGDIPYKVSKMAFRRYFGRFEIQSNNFVAYQISGQFVFSGEGLGHGVGMCQLGALELAKRGSDYRQILSYYFPNHHLEKVY